MLQISIIKKLPLSGLTSSVMEYPTVNLAQLELNKAIIMMLNLVYMINGLLNLVIDLILMKIKKSFIGKSDEPELMFANDTDDIRRLEKELTLGL